MSITVADCLKLPALREAQVVAGHPGLSRIVSAVSVLEYAESSVFTDDLFAGDELIISALINIKDDVAAQCETIRYLYRTGEVGLVLYYLGVFVPALDQRVLDLADELNFPLIVMPQDRFDLRYSEVITEVMEAVIKDEMQETNFAAGILKRISQLPPRHRTIETVLRMLSDRLRCSFLLVERSLEQRGAAAWPMSRSWQYESLLQDYKSRLGLSDPSAPEKRALNGWEVYVQHTAIQLERRTDMILIALAEGEPLTAAALGQAAEVMQLFFGIWEYDFGQEGADGLIKAILNDEPNHMRRIADALNIDIASIHTMWVLCDRPGKLARKERNPLDAERAVMAKLFLQRYYKLALVDTYEDFVVMFLGPGGHRELGAELPEELLLAMGKKGENTLLVLCDGLMTTKDVSASYFLMKSALPAAVAIYPGQHCFNIHELRFAENCMRQLEAGATAEQALLPLRPLAGLKDAEELLDTLAVYLLDAGGSMQRTGDLLYLHKNTIKHRVNKIKQCLGYDITHLPEAYPLYCAIALRRLMR